MIDAQIQRVLDEVYYRFNTGGYIPTNIHFKDEPDGRFSITFEGVRHISRYQALMGPGKRRWGTETEQWEMEQAKRGTFDDHRWRDQMLAYGYEIHPCANPGINRNDIRKAIEPARIRHKYMAEDMKWAFEELMAERPISLPSTKKPAKPKRVNKRLK